MKKCGGGDGSDRESAAEVTLSTGSGCSTTLRHPPTPLMIARGTYLLINPRNKDIIHSTQGCSYFLFCPVAYGQLVCQTIAQEILPKNVAFEKKETIQKRLLLKKNHSQIEKLSVLGDK